MPGFAAPCSDDCSPTSDSRCPASSTGVPNSNTAVVRTRCPMRALRRRARSTAVTESKPASISLPSGSNESASEYPSTAAATERTTSTTNGSRSAGGSARSRSARSARDAVDSAGSVSDASVASGSSASNVLGRVVVNTGANADQSMSVMASVVSSWSRACASARTASSGCIDLSPRRAMSSRNGLSPRPPPSQPPQATEQADSPRARRRCARASRWAFAAAYAACPMPPQTPAQDENRTNASSAVSASSSSSSSAPVTLPAYTSARTSGVVSSSGMDGAMPAVCTTAESGGSVSRRSTRDSRSATSQAATVTLAPSFASSAASSSAPGDSLPLRLVSTRCCAPSAASQRATCPPRAPVPPVISTVPFGR